MSIAATQIQSHEAAARPLPRISVAGKKDMAVIADLYSRTLDRAFDGINREFSRMVSAPAAAQAQVRAALSDPDATVMLARQGDVAVGFAIARRGRLEAMGVLPEARRQGLGTLLVRNLLSEQPVLSVRTPVAQSFFAAVGRETGSTNTSLVEFGAKGFAGAACQVNDYRLVNARFH